MKVIRKGLACTAFEGKLVAYGGFGEKIIPNEVNADNRMNLYTRKRIEKLKPIETYDFHKIKWNSFPSMLSPRKNHSALSIGNEMFTIRCSNDFSKVFDSVTKKFTYIKTLPKWVRTPEQDFFEQYVILYQVVNVSYKIYFFRKEDNKVNVHSYNVKKQSLQL